MSAEDREDRVERRELIQKLDLLERSFGEQLRFLNDTVEAHSGTLDTLDLNMTERHRGAHVPVTPFSGNRDEDFAQYIKQFELICDANNYAPDKRAQILASYLRDKAFYVYDSLPAATKTNYDNLKAALKEKFQTSDYKRYLHQKFQERKQKLAESATSYGCDIHRLGMAALASVDADQRDALIREKFVAGLRPDLHKLIVYSNPKTFHEAMTLAERLEGLQGGESEQSAKHTLLLEGIYDRLQKLELGPRNAVPNWSCGLNSPEQRDQPGAAWNFRAANLNNFRQTLGPRGNQCFRCNRSGHIARNCPMGNSISNVICRLCNRPGHFARNCQRRQVRPRMPQRQFFNGRAEGPARNNPATFPNNIMPRRNEAMMAEEETAETGEQGVRWHPLVASLMTQPQNSTESSRCNVRRHFLELRDHNNNLIRGTEDQGWVQTGVNAQSPFEIAQKRESMQIGRAIKQERDVQNITAIAQHADSCGKAPSKQASAVDNSASKAKICKLTQAGKFNLMLCLLFTLTWTMVAAGSRVHSHFRGSGPMLCQTQDSKVMWKLPDSFTCPKGNHTVNEEVRELKLKLFKRNYVQYKSRAWKCIIIKEDAETFTYFFGDENLKREKKYTEAVSAEECTAMKQFKRCGHQAMVFQGDMYQTNNKLNWYYPGGGINCCRWKKFAVTNCYLYQSAVYKKHAELKMESGAGDVSNCIYIKGQCVLEDGAFLIWRVNGRSLCELIEWKSVSGKMYGTSWLSDDSNLALTFTQLLKTKDCDGRESILSDQGIAVRFPPGEKVRTKRQTEGSRNGIKTDGNNGARKTTPQGGFVSSAQLAASLEAVEIKWKQNMNFAFSHALNSVCNFMKSVIELLKTQILANPTMAVRALVNQSAIFVKAGGNVLEVFPCRELRLMPEDFKFLPMNKTCTSHIPLNFWIEKQKHHGYMDPITNIVHRFSVPMDCAMMRQVPLQLWGLPYLYHADTCEIEHVKNIAPLRVFHRKNQPLIDMKFMITEVLGDLSETQAQMKSLNVCFIKHST